VNPSVEPVFLTSLVPTALEAVEQFSAAEAGYLELSLFCGPRHFNPADGDAVDALKQALARTGVEVFSVHASFGATFDLSTLEGTVRQHAVETHLAEMRLAAELGAQAVVVHPVGSGCPEASQRADRLAASAASLSALAAAAVDLGLNLAVENMTPHNPADDLDELVALVDGLHCPRAGFCFDTGHCHLNGIAQSRMISAFADRLHVIHWHDNNGERDEHLNPGAGNIDWEDYYAGLAAIGFDAPVTVEASNRGLILSEFVRVARLALDERRAMYV